MEVDQSVTLILNHAGEGEEIVFEPEEGVEGNEDGVEVVDIIEEIEEITEEIEEIEEEEEEILDPDEIQNDDEEIQNDDEEIQNIEQEMETEAQEDPDFETIEITDDVRDNAPSSKRNGLQITSDVNIKYLPNKIYGKNSQAPKPKDAPANSLVEVPRKSAAGVKSSVIREIVRYDVTEDWEDDEPTDDNPKVLNDTSIDSVDNQVFEEVNDSELTYDHNVIHEESVEDYNQPEIVKNTENNLVYTVLGPKKPAQDNSRRKDGECIKLEQYNEDAIPAEEGAIYYEGEEIDGMYVSHTVEEGSQEFNYESEQMQNEDLEWANQSEPEQQEENPEQIFLHEDEDGQLYFKDENGTLQPVYLTSDGNYAIADNSSDEQDSQEAIQIQNVPSEDHYVLPDLELKSAVSKQALGNQDADQEDNTVTISLIISEDEHGQKRTQVIIPTTDELKCEICQKVFKTSFQLLKHNRLKHAREEDITTRSFPCDLCPKRFSDQNLLARHRKSHTGDRFQCLECSKTFPSSATLRRHLALHSEMKPLPCIYCGRRFVEKASLAKHEQSHLNNATRTLTCDICRKCFLSVADLNHHKKTHEQERKYDCDICGREFNRLNNLQRHQLVHQQQQGNNEEILSCNVCGITYKFSSSLTRHMVTTHMNPEKLKQQAEEQRRKRENNYKRYLENRKTYELQNTKRMCRRKSDEQDDDD